MMEATIVRSGDGAGATVMGDVWETALEAVCGDSAPAWAGTAASASNRAEDVAKTAMRRIILQYLMDATYQQLSTLSKAKGLIYMTPFYHSSLTEAKFGLARWHFETFEDVELKSPAISFRPIYHFVNPVVDADFSASIKPGLNAGDTGREKCLVCQSLPSPDFGDHLGEPCRPSSNVVLSRVDAWSASNTTKAKTVKWVDGLTLHHVEAGLLAQFGEGMVHPAIEIVVPLADRRKATIFRFIPAKAGITLIFLSYVGSNPPFLGTQFQDFSAELSLAGRRTPFQQHHSLERERVVGIQSLRFRKPLRLPHIEGQRLHYDNRVDCSAVLLHKGGREWVFVATGIGIEQNNVLAGKAIQNPAGASLRVNPPAESNNMLKHSSPPLPCEPRTTRMC
jgi:hypothetical protein